MRTFLLLLLLSAALFGQGQAIPVRIDGSFTEWTNAQTWPDATGDSGGIDILQMWVTNDAEHLYVSVALDTEIGLTDNLIAHNLFLQIDTDNNPNTGFEPQDGFGSEIGFNFNDRFAYYNVEPESTVNFYEAEFRTAPTVTSSRFEWAIRRDAIPDGINPLFPSPTIRLLVRETLGGDELPEAGNVISYTFDETVLPESAPIEVARSADPHVRLAVYNVLADGLLDADRQDEFQRILSSLDADIIGFSECSNTSSAQVKALLDAWVPTSDANGWYTVKKGDLVTASTWPVQQQWSGLWRQHPVLLNVPEALGGPVLFINAHLSCCDADENRQEQADELMAWMEDAKEPGGSYTIPDQTAVIYGGDLNLVGFARQLETLLNGEILDTVQFGEASPPDWDDTPWLDLVPQQTDSRKTFTWQGDGVGNDFPPGRLDFLLVADAVMEVQRSFVLNTEDMSTERLETYGLESGDTGVASDHLPVVVDFLPTGLSDGDNDGWADFEDNCPEVANPDQADWNGNGQGDLCEDSDQDGLTDADELTMYNTSPAACDTDGDGLTDGLEVLTGTTDPLLADTNGNGCPDGTEALTNCSPVCLGDLNGDQVVGTPDLLLMLGVFGTFCE